MDLNAQAPESFDVHNADEAGPDDRGTDLGDAPH
jgi:hypothetical protein